MELRDLHVPQIPNGVKLFALALLLAEIVIGVICGVLFFIVSGSDKSIFLQAASYALGAGTPLFILGLFIATARTGIRAIESRNREIFLHVLPKKLAQIDLNQHDPGRSVIRYTGRRIASSTFQAETNSTDVHVSITRDSSTAYYKIATRNNLTATLVLWMSVDISLKQATVCLYVPTTNLRHASLREKCPSTLNGATESGNYKIDATEPTSTIDGIHMSTLILRTKFESDESLWNASHINFFITDLYLMAASFMRECGAILEIDTAKNHAIDKAS